MTDIVITLWKGKPQTGRMGDRKAVMCWSCNKVKQIYRCDLPVKEVAKGYEIWFFLGGVGMGPRKFDCQRLTLKPNSPLWIGLPCKNVSRKKCFLINVLGRFLSLKVSLVGPSTRNSVIGLWLMILYSGWWMTILTILKITPKSPLINIV